MWRKRKRDRAINSDDDLDLTETDLDSQMLVDKTAINLNRLVQKIIISSRCSFDAIPLLVE